MALTEAAVGAVIGELLKVLLEIKGKIEEYNLTLNRIEATLKKIEPIVKEIDDLNGKLDRKGVETKQLWEEIEKGKELLHCCKKEIGGWCSCLKKQQYQYLGRLQELDESLSSFCNIIVPLRTLRVVTQTHEAVEDVREMVREDITQKDNQHKIMMEKLDEMTKLMLKDSDTSNKALRQGNSPARVPERSVTPVPDQRKQVPGEYGWVDSKGKDSGGASDFASSFPSKGKESPSCNVSLPTRKVPASPKDHAPPPPVPPTSGFSQEKSNLEEGRHPDQTKRPTTTMHSVPPLRPSPPPKAPEIVRETRLDAPVEIDPYQPVEISSWQAHVQPGPKQVKQIPDKAKEVPRETSYSYSPDNKSKVSISPVSSNDFTQGALFGKNSPSGWYSLDPAKPVSPATANYGFGVPPKSPVTEAVPSATTATNLTSSRPYILHTSPNSGNDINPIGQATDRSQGFVMYHQPSASAAPPNHWQQPHVQPEPKQVKKIPDKAKEVPRNFSYSYSSDSKNTVSISPVPSNDFTRGASSGKGSPSGQYSSDSAKPGGSATSNYGFSVPSKSPETKPLGPTTAATNQTYSRPYIPPDPPSSGKNMNPKGQATDRSHGFTTYHQPASSAAPSKPQEMKTNFVKDPSGYSTPTEKRSTIPAVATSSNDNPLTRSYILQYGQPKTTEVDHNQGNMVPDKWRTTKQPISGSSYAPPSNKALPNKLLETKKGAYEEEWSSDENDE